MARLQGCVIPLKWGCSALVAPKPRLMQKRPERVVCSTACGQFQCFTDITLQPTPSSDPSCSPPSLTLGLTALSDRRLKLSSPPLPHPPSRW